MVASTRSSRVTLLKKTIPGAPISGNRKSGRLEKIKKAEKAAMMGPLRRSVRRSKNLPSSSSATSSATSNPSKSSNSRTLASCSYSSLSSKLKTKKKAECVKRLGVEEEEEVGEEEERDVGSSSKVNNKRLNARVYRAEFDKTEEEDWHEESDKMDSSAQEGVNSGGEEMQNDGKLPSEDDKAKETAESSLNGPLKELSGDNVTLGSFVPSNATNHEASSSPDRDQSDFRGEEASQMLVSTDSVRAKSRLNGPVKELSENNATLGSSGPSNAITHESNGEPESDQSDCCREESSPMLLSSNPALNESLIQNCSEHDKGEKLISSKRKGTMTDMQSDVSATLADNGNCNLSADADPSRLCDNTTGNNGSCSKRIRRISLSDEQSGQRKLIHNVNQLSSKVEGVKLSTANKEERPQGNDVEYIWKKQRSLHLLLKPEIAKLCEILLLPDNVKNMVDSCLQYVMNNRQICTEPASILQAFQLSLCWIASSLLNHKLDFEASVKLAKRRLNFNCKKATVDEIYSMLWTLKDEILFHTVNADVTDPLKASEPSNRVYSYTEVAPEVELVNKDNSKSTKEIRKCENQMEKLLLMQQEEKHKLKADIEKQKSDFMRRYKIEYAAIRCCSPNDATRRKKLMDFNKEYDRRLRELKRQHAKRFSSLEAKQQEAMRKFEEYRAPGELLNFGASKDFEGRVIHLQNCYQAQSPNGPKNEALVSGHVIEGKSYDNIVEAMTRAGSGVGLAKSLDVNSPVVLVCSNPVELQTPPVKHADANEMGIMASEDRPISRNKCHSINENECGSQGNIVSKHSNSREQCSAGASSMADEGNFSCDSHNGGNAAQMHEADGRSDSNNGNTRNLPSSDERVAYENFKSSQEHVHSPNGMSLQNFENSAQIYEAGDGNCSNNDATLNSTLVDDGAIVSLSDREVHLEMPGTGSFSRCTETVAAMNPPSSMQHISGGEINVSILDRELSRPCGAASPSNVPCSNQLSLEKQNPDGVSSSVPAEQIAVEVPETSHEGVSVSISDKDSPAEMPSTVTCPGYPKNVTPLNSSSMDQISDEGSVLDGILSSRPSGASNPSNALATMPPLNPQSLQQQLPERVSDGQHPVIVPETSHEVAECQLTETVMVDRSTTLDHQDGVPRTMAENTLPQEVPVSRPAQFPLDPDTARETQNSSVSGAVDIEQANQSNQVSVVVEPPEQVQQLPCGESLSSNQDLSNLTSATEIQHQQTNDDTHSNHIHEASIEVPTQGIEQHASNLELDSRSYQVFVHQASTLDLDSPMPSGVRRQSADPRNLSTTSEISNHSVQTATHSGSRTVMPFSHDPLRNELEIIHKMAEQNMKNYEETKLQLQSDFEKEMAELQRKYFLKYHSKEVEFQQRKKDLDTRYKTVSLNKALAEAFRLKCVDHKVSGMQQDPSYTLQLLQLFQQQNAPFPRPPSFAGALPPTRLQTTTQTRAPPPTRLHTTTQTMAPPPTRPHTTNQTMAPPPTWPHATNQTMAPPPTRPHSTTSSQTMVPRPTRLHTTTNSQAVPPQPTRPYTTACSQTVVPPPTQPCTTTSSQTVVPPPTRPVYNTSGIFSGVPFHTNPTPSPSGNFQAAGEIRSPAPHLQRCRPSMSVPASSQPSPGNVSTSRSSFSDLLLSVLPKSNHPGPIGPFPASSGGLPTPNLSAMDSCMDANNQSSINPPNAPPRMSDLASFGTSISKLANLSHQATSDVVCLSDDD